jgi:hypothetical protein
MYYHAVVNTNFLQSTVTITQQIYSSYRFITPLYLLNIVIGVVPN